MHKCDCRCLSESGHHSWPSPAKNECLCNQKFNGSYVWCPKCKTTKQEKTGMTWRELFKLIPKKDLDSEVVIVIVPDYRDNAWKDTNGQDSN